MSRLSLARLLVSIAALLALLVAAAPALAQAGNQSVTWQRFDVDIEVRPDGSFSVAEIQQIQFRGTFQRGFRVIPTDRVAGITDITVEEVVGNQTVQYRRGNGSANTFAMTRQDDGIRVDWWFPTTTNQSRTFVIHYVVQGGIRVYDDGDQLWWRAIYADRAGPIQSSTITVRLPADVSQDQLRTAYYLYRANDTFGADREAGDAEIAEPGVARFRVGDLPAEVGVEVRVQFPHGIIAAEPPAWQTAADRVDWIRQFIAPIGTFLSLLLTLLILAGGGMWLFLHWASGGRDPAIGTVPPRLSDPPSDLPAPLAGTLVDEVANVRDAVATLVDLADRGAVSMADIQNTELVGSTRDVKLVLETPLDDPNLKRYERTLLTGLFGSEAPGGSMVQLSNIKGRFTAAIPVLQEQLHQGVQSAGLFHEDPEKVRRRYKVYARFMWIAGGILAVGFGIWLGSLIPVIWLPGLSLVGLGFATSWLATHMPRRTQAGALESARWTAFKRHLEDVAHGQDQSQRVEIQQRYLPYAVAFGIDRDFLHNLESVGSPPPPWYGDHVGAYSGYGSRGRRGPGGVIIVPGGWYGGSWTRGPSASGGTTASTGPTLGGGDAGIGFGGGANSQGWSDTLADVLNSASRAMASGGGGGGWSGGGFGGGGGGGGGSGGFG